MARAWVACPRPTREQNKGRERANSRIRTQSRASSPDLASLSVSSRPSTSREKNSLTLAARASSDRPRPNSLSVSNALVRLFSSSPFFPLSLQPSHNSSRSAFRPPLFGAKDPPNRIVASLAHEAQPRRQVTRALVRSASFRFVCEKRVPCRSAPSSCLQGAPRRARAARILLHTQTCADTPFPSSLAPPPSPLAPPGRGRAGGEGDASDRIGKARRRNRKRTPTFRTSGPPRVAPVVLVGFCSALRDEDALRADSPPRAPVGPPHFSRVRAVTPSLPLPTPLLDARVSRALRLRTR